MMLIFILVDVQYSQNAVFSFEKCGNHENHSSSGFHLPVKNSLISKISYPPLPPLTAYLENSSLSACLFMFLYLFCAQKHFVHLLFCKCSAYAKSIYVLKEVIITNFFWAFYHLLQQNSMNFCKMLLLRNVPDSLDFFRFMCWVKFNFPTNTFQGVFEKMSK